MNKMTIALLTIMLIAAPVLAQDEVPADAIGSGTITFDQLSEELVMFRSVQEGIAVLYVLPIGWEVTEEGIQEPGDLESGKKTSPRFLISSTSPGTDENGAPDLAFELSIYHHGLLDSMPTGLSEDEQKNYEQDMFFNFLDLQLAMNIAYGLKCTNQNEIYPKPYSVGTRPPTYFVPIYYTTDGGAMIYTFTSVTAGKVWMLKFLVQASQVDNYQALVALVINNSFAMTEDEFDSWQEYYLQQEAEQTN